MLPPSSYKKDTIKCMSGGTTIACTTTIDSTTGNLTVELAPPCSKCAVKEVLSFTIDELMNPPFINDISQSIIVRTAHPQGLVEENIASSSLNPSTAEVKKYNRTGSKDVGSAYKMTLELVIPNYISTNGGQLLLDFVANESYVNAEKNGSGFNYPTKLKVTDEVGTDYTNTIIYDTAFVPNPVKQIVIQICDMNPCSGKVSIEGLSRGYYALSGMTQKVSLTTKSGEAIAMTNFSVL